MAMCQGSVKPKPVPEPGCVHSKPEYSSTSALTGITR
jgi:hypothetical protein